MSDPFTRNRAQPFEIMGDTFYLSPMSGTAYERLLADHKEEDLESLGVLAAVVCICACDEQGTRRYQDDEAQRVKDELPLNLILELGSKGLQVSGLTDDEGKEPGND